MTENIRIRNENFRELKLRLRRNPRQSLVELDNILSNVQDKKAFVFLMDSYETEKEITRDILEQMLENTIHINSDLIDILESKNKNIGEMFLEVFNIKNIKSLLIAAIVLGLLVSIATNENVAMKIFDIVNSQTQEENK
jgi:ribosomal protein L4